MKKLIGTFIGAIPAADVVEVVRCKDCIKRKTLVPHFD